MKQPLASFPTSELTWPSTSELALLVPTSELSSYPARPPPEVIQDPLAYENDRTACDLRLKSRFEQIFSKYEHDFTGVGDEIDLETFELVVDNGHLQNSTNECDTGQSDPFRPVGHHTDWEDDDVSGSENSSSDEDSVGPGSVESISEESTVLDEAAISGSTTSDTAHAPSESGLFKSVRILEQVPGLKESIASIQAHADNSSGRDTNTIEALGMSIAKHLSSLMQQGPPKGNPFFKPSRGVWAFPELPTLRRERTEVLEHQANTAADGLAAQIEPAKRRRGSGSRSIWAPLELPLPRKRRKMNKEPADSLPNGEEPAQSTVLSSKACVHCGIRVTSHWRTSDDGDLCNACGTYYWRWGAMKPLDNLDCIEQDIESEDDEHYAANTSRTRKLVGWTNQDDALIIKLKEFDRCSWIEIAAAFPGRGQWAPQTRYANFLKRQECHGREILVEQGFSFPLANSDFTAAEETELMHLKEGQGLGWEEIAQRMPRFSIHALTAQHKYLLCVGEVQAAREEAGPEVRSETRRKANLKYVPGEDEAIQKLHEVNGLTFEEIAELYPSRTPIALQKRYTRERARRKKAHEDDHGEGTFIVPTAPRRVRCDQSIEVSEDSGRKDTQLFDLGDYRVKFSKGDDNELKRLRSSTTLDWEEIALRFPNRSIASLKERCSILQTLSKVETIMTEKSAEPKIKKPKTELLPPESQHKPAASFNYFHSLLSSTPVSASRNGDRATEESEVFDILQLTSGSNERPPVSRRSPSLQATTQGGSTEQACSVTSKRTELTTPASNHVDSNGLLQTSANVLLAPPPGVDEATYMASPLPIQRCDTPEEVCAREQPVHITPDISPARTAIYDTPRIHNAHGTPYFLGSPKLLEYPRPEDPDRTQQQLGQFGLTLDPSLFDDCATPPQLAEQLAGEGQPRPYPVVHHEMETNMACNGVPESRGSLTQQMEPSLEEMISEAIASNGSGPADSKKINRYIAQHYGPYTARYDNWTRRVRDCLTNAPHFKQISKFRFELATKTTEHLEGVPGRTQREPLCNVISQRAPRSKKQVLSACRAPPSMQYDLMIPASAGSDSCLTKKDDEHGNNVFAFAPDQRKDGGELWADVPMYDQISSPLHTLTARREDGFGPKITREPLSSSPRRPAVCKTLASTAWVPTPAPRKQESQSSPVRTKKRSPMKVVYGRRRSLETVQTPKNAASAFLANRRKRPGSINNTPNTTGYRRGSSVTRFMPGSAKRIVETPLRETAPEDPDEDELA